MIHTRCIIMSCVRYKDIITPLLLGVGLPHCRRIHTITLYITIRTFYCLETYRNNVVVHSIQVRQLTDAPPLVATRRLHVATVDAEVHVAHLGHLPEVASIGVEHLHDVGVVPGQPEGPGAVPVHKGPCRVQSCVTE